MRLEQHVLLLPMIWVFAPNPNKFETHLSDSRRIAEAVSVLRRGDLLAMPTETVYGLGADASNAIAVEKIYQLKGRPANHPLIVHLQAPPADSKQKEEDWLGILSPWARHIPESALVLIQHFWPGPLTLVFQKSKSVLDCVTGGQDTVALRSPSHPLAQGLLKAFGGGIAAPSANRFGRISPTSVAHVRAEFIDCNDLLILDGGDCQFGIESTILDVSTEGAPRLLRPGSITLQQVKERTGIDVVTGAQDIVSSPRVSGSLKAHYAPQTPLYLYSGDQWTAQLQKRLQEDLLGKKVALVLWDQERLNTALLQNDVANKIDYIFVPQESFQFAQGLYRLLRDLDQSNYQSIYMPTPPAGEDWDAVRDRLQRASFGSGPSSSNHISS